MDRADAAPFAFRIDLRPHRSLGRRGFLVLMGTVSAVSFACGLAFAAMGAWPILGFFGLDVLVLFLAFRWNYGAARARERIELIGDELLVTHRPAHGPVRQWSLQPYWVRVGAPDPARGIDEVTLMSHGRSLPVGGFLGPDERIELAARLADALRRYRESLIGRADRV